MGSCCRIPASPAHPSKSPLAAAGLGAEERSGWHEAAKPVPSRTFPQGPISPGRVPAAAAAPELWAGARVSAEAVLEGAPTWGSRFSATPPVLLILAKTSGLFQWVAYVATEAHACVSWQDVGFVNTGAHEESTRVTDERNNHYRLHKVAGLFLCLALRLSPTVALSECLSGLVFQIFQYNFTAFSTRLPKCQLCSTT